MAKTGPPNFQPEGPPYMLGDLILLMKQGMRLRVEEYLGAGVLVGRIPAPAPGSSGDTWVFRTRLAVVPSTPSLDRAGLSPDMLVWPLKRRGASALLRSAIRVGRSPTNDVVVPHVDVSKLHARLVPQGEGMSLVDEGSLNGTSLNGKRLTPNQAAPLNNGDRIALGALPPLQFLITRELLAMLGP